MNVNLPRGILGYLSQGFYLLIKSIPGAGELSYEEQTVCAAGDVIAEHGEDQQH